MSFQDRNALALDALSIIKDTPPNSKQPSLGDGIHLRWAPGDNRDFPLKGGYYLFRRPVGGMDTTQVCVMARVKSLTAGVAGQEKSVDTGSGVLAAVGPLLKPVVQPGSTIITGLTIDSQGILFTLPASTAAGMFTLQVSFDDVTGAEVLVVAKLQGVDVASSKAAPPAQQQQLTLAVNPPGADSIVITGLTTPPSAQLLELCYTPIGTVPPTPVNSPLTTAALAAANASTASIPGTGWQQIPNLTPLTTPPLLPFRLPLYHPLYPANTGSESINASTAMAKPRFRYGQWADSFGAPATTASGIGTITLTNGSPMVTGVGTTWTADLVGSLLQLPLTASDYTAYAIMAVLAPGCLVLSRDYSGNTQSTATFQFTTGDDFAELHDRIASLLESPNDMRAAVVPPPLDQGTVVAGKCVLAYAGGSAQITGIGTHWTANLTGCFIEIGPAWFQTTNLTGSTTYRIQAVNPTLQQITLDRGFVGLPFLVPTAKCDYRIFARTVGDDPNASTPSFDFKPMDLLELASLMPSYAQALGLYWVDTPLLPGDVFDYIVIADHENRFAQSANNALAWLNGSTAAADLAGSSLDAWVKSGVAYIASPPLAAPTKMQLYRLDTGGARVSIADPNRADSDAGVSVGDVIDWTNLSLPQPMPVMLNLWRLARGTDASNLLPVGTNTTGYQDLQMLLPAPPDPSGASNKAPPNWPAAPIHFVDSGDGAGLDVGWYSYRGNAIDLFGRYSPDSAPIPWTDVDNSPTTITDAIHLADTTPPPPPAGVTASFLDDRDPYMLQDSAFTNWRSHFPGATEWAAWQPGNPYPAFAPALGLRLSFRWPWAAQNQGPDLGEFRVYALEEPLNARPGSVTSVAAASATSSSVTLDIGAVTDVTKYSANYAGATLQAGNQAYAITASQAGGTSMPTSVVLTVTNGGTNQLTPPASNVDGAIVIPDGRPLALQLLSPANWEWLAAIPKDVGVRYDVEMAQDPSAILYDDALNKFAGALATWNGSAFVLDAIPSPYNLSGVRPGIDVLALSSDNPPSYFVLGIVSASGLQVVPVQPPNPAPAAATQFQWKIGPANRGIQGIAGQWTLSSRQLLLDGTPNLANVNLGTDLVYVAPSGVTPDKLNYFFSIESLVGNTLTLLDNGNLSALPSGPLPWKIGRPVRYYEVFLPKPAADVVLGSTDACTLLKPTPDEPVRHGTIAVSSVDYRTEVRDKYWPSRARTGNESLLAGPAPVFRVLRDPVETPSYNWNVTRLYATRANYKDESYFTVRWNKPVNAKSAHVYKAMDSTIFVAHWRLTTPLTPAATPVPPPAIPAFLASFNANKASNNYTAAAALYNQLDDVTLWWLASQPELADAFMQMTITPLGLSDPANADRLGPDDPATYVANPSGAYAYLATLGGKSQNRYFFCVALLDGAQNRSPLGSPTPPVYLPKAVPPRTPAITKVLGGDRQIIASWASNREPNLAEYRIYRAETQESAGDLRLMTLVWTEVILIGDPSSRPAEVVWSDTHVIGGQDYWYSLVAVDSSGNVSRSTTAIQARPYDATPPPPLPITAAAWQPGTTSFYIQVTWTPQPQMQIRVQRLPQGQTRWILVTDWLDGSVGSGSDSSAEAWLSHDLRLQVRSAAGNLSAPGPVTHITSKWV